MKANYILILILILSSFLSFSQSAETAYKMKKAAPSKMAKSLKAYQQKSENKITDFFSYLNILGNKTIQNDMKLHTIAEIKKLFKDQNSTIPDFINCKNIQNGNCHINTEISLATFLNQIQKSSETIVFSADNLQKSFAQINNESYSWTVGYDLKMINGKSTMLFKNVMQNATVINENKTFGKHSKTVQSTYLSDIWLK